MKRFTFIALLFVLSLAASAQGIYTKKTKYDKFDDSYYCICQAAGKAEQRERDKRQREEIDRICREEAKAKEQERMRRWMLETE